MESCDRVSGVMWPCRWSHVTVEVESCDRVSGVMWPCRWSHVTGGGVM